MVLPRQQLLPGLPDPDPFLTETFDAIDANFRRMDEGLARLKDIHARQDALGWAR